MRLSPDLLNFPVQGKRSVNQDSVKRVQYLNKKFGIYEKKNDFKVNFFIDKERKYILSSSNNLKYKGDVQNYLWDIINSNKIYYYIHKKYNDSVYRWSIEYINKTKYHPFRHIYSLLAVAKTLEDISINQKKLGLNQTTNKKDIKQHLFNF